MKKVILLLLFVFITSYYITAFAQVTIGSDKVPEKAALLDIKTKDGGAGEISTEGGGILFPRVLIPDSTKLTTLNLFGLSDAEVENSTQHLRHRGLTVYNIGNTKVRPGIYTWDGQRWRNSAYRKELNFFYMPSIEIPLTNIQPINLHQAYIDQFGNPKSKSQSAPNTIPRYENQELYYYVTGVSKDTNNSDIIYNIQISDTGIMTYQASTDLPADLCCGYVNIVFVVK